jgi:hypothetical protein
MKRLALTVMFTVGVTGLCGDGLVRADGMSMSSSGSSGGGSSAGASVGGWSGAPESMTKGKASGSRTGVGAPTVVGKAGGATVASKPATPATSKPASTPAPTVASKPVSTTAVAGPAWNVPDGDGRRRL